jgi:hypothetical protein
MVSLWIVVATETEISLYWIGSYLDYLLTEILEWLVRSLLAWDKHLTTAPARWIYYLRQCCTNRVQHVAPGTIRQTAVIPGRTLPKSDQPSYTLNYKATDRAGFTFRRVQFAFWQARVDATGYMKLHNGAFIICALCQILLQQSNQGKGDEQGK